MTTSLVNQHKTYQIRFDDGEENISYMMLDPAFEAPKYAWPAGMENGLLRPLSTFVTVGAAHDAFVGYVAAGAWARGTDDYGQKARLYHAGTVEVELDAPTPVTEGLKLQPFATGGNVQDHIFQLTGTGGSAPGKWTIAEIIECPRYTEDYCSTGAAATDTSPSSARAAKTLLRVHATWNLPKPPTVFTPT